MVQRIRIRYAKRGPLRFTSHRDFARAFERAVRRAGVPIAYSQGFTPHPKISYASAAPTGVASEAEYLEIGLREAVDPARVRVLLDGALSPGLDVVQAVEADAGTSLADRIDAARWRIELPEADPDRVAAAVAAFVRAEKVPVERLTKQGRRTVDARAAVVSMAMVSVAAASMKADASRSAADGRECAILDVVVRQVTPSVRPDDVLAGLRVVSQLDLPAPARATRLAQGRLTPEGEIVDPLEAVDEASIGGPAE